jgi:peptidoglycan/xylan/chitin deacetylase (PgdA/CDA1 family)
MGLLNPNKRRLARFLEKVGIAQGFLAWLRLHHRNRYIRVVNYHGTPAAWRDGLASHLRFYLRHFVPAHAADLELLLSGKPWPHSRPGLLITFDDGLRNNFEIASPLLEQYGFSGWFMLPAGFIECPPSKQRAFAAAHHIWNGPDHNEERIAMSWSEAAALQERHVIGCHTLTHRRLGSDVPFAEVEREIAQAKRLMQERLGRTIEVFCWVGGEEHSYSSAAARLIRDAGYRWSFMTNTAPVLASTSPFQLQRSNIEADWPMDVVMFQLCGIMDILYAFKRARVNRLTAS